MSNLCSGQRAFKILDDVANRWLEDPERAKKITWEGLDNSKSEEDSVDCDCCDGPCECTVDNSDWSSSCEESAPSPRHYTENLPGFVVEDHDMTQEEQQQALAELQSFRDQLKQTVAQPLSQPAISQPVAQPKFVPIQQTVAPAPPPLLFGRVSVPHLQPNDQVVSNNNDLVCTVCSLHECNVILIPCGHNVVCLKCIQAYLAKKQEEGSEFNCPTCRQQILQVIRVFR